VLEQVPRISDVCRNAGFDTATVALQHAIRYPHVATTIVSMHTIDEVERNMRALDQELPAELMERVAEVAAPIKNRMWFEGRPENNIPPSDPQRYVPQTPSQTHE
jgi:L-galactose dehydrogenase